MHMITEDPIGEIRKISRGPSEQGEMADDKQFLKVNQAIAEAEARKGNLENALVEINKFKEPTHEQIMQALANC